MTRHEPNLAVPTPAGGTPPALPAPAEAGADFGLPATEMADLVAAADWAAGPLGPPDAWPQSLRTAVDICLSSRFPILLWWGPELVMIYNDAYRPMLGRTKHPRALGSPGREVWPEIWDVIGPMLEQVTSGGGATWSTDQLLVVERNCYPEETYFTFSYSPISDESGGVGGVFCAVSETTERVLGERRLATLAEMAGLMGSESRAQVLHSATATLGTNAADHPVAVVLDVPVGTEPGALVEVLSPQLRQYPAVVPHELTEVVREAVESGRATRAPSQERETGVRTWHAYPVADSVGDASGGRRSAVVVLGESPTRRWDSSVEAYATLCATHVAAALADVRALEEERRRHEALVALDRAKSTFFTNISHELRTPLTLISGPVQQALAAEADPEQRGRLELVERNAARLSRMVDAMLDFGRTEAGGLVPRPERVDVSELGRGLAESFRPAVERVGLAFEHDCGDGIRACLDRDMLERVVLNLLSNALKYTPSGSVRLGITREGDDLVVTVSDTGIGIDPDDVERAFTRFERLPSGTGARSHEGAGLGLAMVRQLVGLMGGEVSVCSEVGRGATFTVRLPVAPERAPQPEVGGSTMTPRGVDDFVREAESWGAPGPAAGPGAQPAVRATGDGSARRPRVLVAEDNADLGAYLADVLGREYDVEVVPDGSTALERVRSGAPDLLLTDIMMPGLDGYGLVSAIRGEPGLGDLPVVVLSARAGDEETSTALAAGADDYLVKPFSVVELQARVASILERAGARTRDAAWRRAVTDGFHDALVILELDGRVLEVNERFADVLGWGPSLRAATAPYPWDATDPGTTRFGDLVARAARPGEAPQAAEVVLVARDGRHVPASVRVGLVEGAPGQPPRLLATVRDLTAEHEARERRARAAALTAELADAEELTDVVAAAMAGLGVLFGGEATVDVVVGDQRHLFTTGGPMAPEALDPVVAEGLEERPAEGGVEAAADGIRLTADGAGLTCTVWVAFPVRRPVLADERVAGDLIVQALALACDRSVLSSGFAEREQHLRRAIESHEEIGQAVGILVERHRWTTATAFEQLKRASQNHNTRLREVARKVVESGADPGA